MSGRMIFGANHSKDRRASKPWLIITQASCSFSGSNEHEFEAEARQHQRGQGCSVMSRWAQFVALGLAATDGPTGLRDIVSNLSTQGRKLYHLGVATVSLLAGARQSSSRTLSRALFGRLLSRCQQCAPRPALQARCTRTIDLAVSWRPWAPFDARRPRSKLHSGWSGGPSAELRQRPRARPARQGRPHVDVSSRQRGRGGPRVSWLQGFHRGTGRDLRDAPEGGGDIGPREHDIRRVRRRAIRRSS